ncbi:MAG: hypothetical protein ABWX83_01660 [Luteibacter sp.]
MVTYAVRCADQGAHDCLKTVEVDIGIPELSTEQIDSIFSTGKAAVDARQLAQADDCFRCQEAEAIVPDTTYFVSVELDASVCSSCLKDRSTEIPGAESDPTQGTVTPT